VNLPPPTLLLVLGAAVFLLSARNETRAGLGREIKTDWRGVPVYQTSFGLSPSSPPPSKFKHATDEWLGTWDTVTSDGRTYTIQLSQQGDRIVGFIPNVSRPFAARFDGVPSPSGEEMTFSFTRPATGETDRGKLRLTSKETFSGSFVNDSVPNKTFTWSGTRKQ